MPPATAKILEAFYCPDCTRELVGGSLGLTETQVCTHCRAHWLEKGGLASLRFHYCDYPDLDWSISRSRASGKRCPFCAGAPLLEMPFSKISDVMLSRCAKCEGNWLSATDLPSLTPKKS